MYALYVMAFLEFVHLPSYENSAKGVISEEMQRALEAQLSSDPYAGDVVAETGGVRKVRVAQARRGKSGSARVIYYYRSSKGRIYLMFAYAKSDMDNVSRAARHALRRRIEQLEAEP